ncbi:hypothetical protein J6590_065507 [Homalodisca vitripennis]|nr:hypothetical protein J6590_065507 [Homalodisca vitripennis]
MDIPTLHQRTAETTGSLKGSLRERDSLGRELAIRRKHAGHCIAVLSNTKRQMSQMKRKGAHTVTCVFDPQHGFLDYSDTSVKVHFTAHCLSPALWLRTADV